MHTLVAKEPVDHVVFDTSFLDIKRVVNVDGSKELKYTLADRFEPYGSALTVELPKELKKGEYAEVSIEYATTEKCTAVQWLNPEQTFGGKHPFMYHLPSPPKNQLCVLIHVLGSPNLKPSMRDQCYPVKTLRP